MKMTLEEFNKFCNEVEIIHENRKNNKWEILSKTVTNNNRVLYYLNCPYCNNHQPLGYVDKNIVLRKAESQYNTYCGYCGKKMIHENNGFIEF